MVFNVARSCGGILLSVFLAFAAGCVGLTSGQSPMIRSLTTDVSRAFEPLRVRSVLVLPLQLSSASSANGADSTALTAELVDVFDLKTGLEIINAKNPQLAADAVTVASVPLTKESLRVVGEKSAAEGVLVGTFTRFDESDGSRLGATNGAAVGFSLQLLDPRSGEPLWSARYEQEEQPLTDNLFALRETLHDGLAFMNRAQLVHHGFESAAEEFEKLRRP
jgi:TolB-like protein